MYLDGNREDYFNPRNSYINDVLDSRRGIPIRQVGYHLAVQAFSPMSPAIYPRGNNQHLFVASWAVLLVQWTMTILLVFLL